MYRVPAKGVSCILIAAAIVSGKAHASSLLDLSEAAFGTTSSVVHLGEPARPQIEAQAPVIAIDADDQVTTAVMPDGDAPEPLSADWMAEALPAVMRGAIAVTTLSISDTEAATDE